MRPDRRVHPNQRGLHHVSVAGWHPITRPLERADDPPLWPVFYWTKQVDEGFDQSGGYRTDLDLSPTVMLKLDVPISGHPTTSFTSTASADVLHWRWLRFER